MSLEKRGQLKSGKPYIRKDSEMSLNRPNRRSAWFDNDEDNNDTDSDLGGGIGNGKGGRNGAELGGGNDFEDDIGYGNGNGNGNGNRRGARGGESVMPSIQRHVHEFEGSTKLAEFDEDVHNHRFAGVSGQAIEVPGGHVHRLFTRTDFFDHFHNINQITGLQVPVGNGKHVHFARGVTTFVDGHRHEFQVATLIDSPLLPEPQEDD